VVKLERLGERIRELRYLRGLTQAQLAHKAGVGEKTLKRLEGGHTDVPRPETLAALAGALGVATEQLVAVTEQAGPPPALHQLPRPPQNFTARRVELALLESHIVERNTQVVSLHGMGGVGKTAIALVIAERLVDRYPDGQLFLDLRGTTDPLTPRDAMLHVIRSIDPARQPPKTEIDVAAAYRTVLRGKRVLCFFDNAANREQVEPLVPPQGSLLLVTSRQRFALQGAALVALTPLDAVDARALIDTLAPRASAVGERLAKLCGGLPLALSLAARALAERPDLEPAEYTARLADDSNRLAQLDASEERGGGVAASVELSFDMLDDELSAAARALAVFPQHFDRMAAGALWGLPDAATDRRIGRLVRFNLLEWDGAGNAARYRLHDLVRLFLDARLSEPDREQLRLMHARYYIDLLRTTDRDLRRGRNPVEALAGIDIEWTNVRAALAYCQANSATNSAAAQLSMHAVDTCGVLRLRLRPADRIAWYESALAATRARKDALEGRLLAELGRAHQDLGDARRARELCEAAVALLTERGDEIAQAFAWVALGDALHTLGDARATIDAAQQGLALARKHNSLEHEASALVVLGWGYFVLGELAEVIEHTEAGLPIARKIGDRALEGMALLANAFAQRRLGNDARAREIGELSLENARDLGDRRIEGYSLLALSQPLSPGNEHFTQQALEISRETGDRRMEGHALVAEGTRLSTRGETLAAIGQAEQAAAIALETGDRSLYCNALSLLGVTYTMAGDYDRAIERLDRAEKTLRDIGNRRFESLASWLLGCALELRGDNARALAAMERTAAYQAQIKHPGLALTEARIAALRDRVPAPGAQA
jgi:transcriptional regulator with XRE-family HTH domain/tetratricopeptide (TPR) repeat protein